MVDQGGTLFVIMRYSSYEEQGDTPPVIRYSSNKQGDIGEWYSVIRYTRSYYAQGDTGGATHYGTHSSKGQQ